MISFDMILKQVLKPFNMKVSMQYYIILYFPYA